LIFCVSLIKDKVPFIVKGFIQITDIYTKCSSAVLEMNIYTSESMKLNKCLNNETHFDCSFCKDVLLYCSLQSK
jgi:hypothetical protein